MFNYNFANLFKYFRLQSGFNTVNSFVNYCADFGYIYDNSKFFQWQSGQRTPKKRETIIKIIKIFAKKNGIKSIEEANLFLESCQQGYLNSNEIKQIGLKNTNTNLQLIEQIESSKKTKKISKTFYLTGKTIKKIDQMSKVKNISKSQLIQDIIDEMLI